jgi:hypothetical protein
MLYWIEIMEKSTLQKKGEIFLEGYYFNANEGFLNKDDKSISLSEGMAFSNKRNLIFNFSELYGQLDKTIYLKNASMTSCANPRSRLGSASKRNCY